MQSIVSKFLPNSLKEFVKQTNIYTQREAKRLALSSKRLDICAAQFAHVFHLSKHPSVEGKVCLEIGSGWVLSHALVCYLLGAKKVIATDIVPCARPETLSLALKTAIHSVPRDILAPFSSHSMVRERLSKLLSIPEFDFDTLKELGIEYVSPVDFAIEKQKTQVDFIYSYSVLEHVPKADIKNVLSNIFSNLNKGGAMIHCIHLEDHKDIQNKPFEFLSIPDGQYTRNIQSARGNRIRCSEWQMIFDGLEGAKTDLFYSYTRQDADIPKIIDSTISYRDERDLQITHIGVYTRKV